MSITLTINQNDVLKEVAQTAEYTGDKMTEDSGAYERIRIVDDNQDELKLFWDECRAEVTKAFARLLGSETMSGTTYSLVLNVSAAFDSALTQSMQLGLKSYFVQSIVARWYVYANKKEAADYSARAAALLDEVREKAYFKKKPKRPTYS